MMERLGADFFHRDCLEVAPDLGGFSKNRGLSIISRRQTKSFSVQQFFKNAAEVWASSPYLRSK